MENSRSRVFSAFVNIALGILLLIFARQFLDTAGTVLGVVFLVLGIQKIISFIVFTRRSDIKTTASMLFLGVVTLIMGIVFLAMPEILNSIIKLIVAVWMFLMGGISAIVTYTYKKDEESKWKFVLFDAILNFTIGILVLVSPLVWEFFISLIFPIQLMWQGFATLIEGMPSKNGKLHISLPSWAEAFLPQKTIKQIKENIKEKDIPKDVSNVIFSKSDFAVDNVEVFVHMSERSSSSFGHVDIGFGDYAISYGNYDHSKQNIRLGGMLYDGIFFIAPRKEYLQFSLSEAGKTIMGYELNLSQEQKDQIKTKIEDFMQNCEEWILSEQDKKDSEFSARISECGGTLYRVVKSSFRTYFVLNTNCSLLSEVLLGDAGVPRPPSFGGAVTPGSVYAMYEKVYAAKSPLISKRNIYLGDELLNNIEKEKNKI